MTRTGELSDRARALAAIPATEIRPQCDGICTILLVELTDTARRWRCEKCLRYLDAPKYRPNEVPARRKRPREPLPDQTTIYDLFQQGD